MLVISVEGGYNRRANNERTLFAMADMLDLRPATPLLILAGKKWIPAEPLEGRALGAVKRSLATPKTIKIVGAETSTTGMRSGGRTSGMAGTTTGTRPRTAARSTTGRAGNSKTGAGMGAGMAAGMGAGTLPRKRGRPRRTPIS